MNQQITKTETKMTNLKDGFYWLSCPRDPQRSLVRLYTHPQTKERGVGFGIWDGAAFLPLSDLTEDSELIFVLPPEDQNAEPSESEEDIIHLLRFMCETWHKINEWSYTCNDANLMETYPVIQGTTNQINLAKIGSQPYDKKRLRRAIQRILDTQPSKTNEI